MGKTGKGSKMNENLSHRSRTCLIVLRINIELKPLLPSSLHGQELGNQPK